VIAPARRVLVLVPLVLLLVVMSGCTTSGSTAATVGGASISVEQLRSDVALFGFLNSLSGAPCGTPVEGESDESACARLALANDIREELVSVYAAEHQVEVDRATVNDAVVQLEQSLGGAEVLRTQLADAGLTRGDVVALAARVLLVDAVQRAVAEERLDEQTLRATYDEEVGSFTTVEVAHILVSDRTKAERIAAEVTPKTFERTARRESIDPGSAPRGGSLGSFTESGFVAQFDPDFVQAALALRPGEISGPVRTQFGWHVIRLVRRDVEPFEDVVDQLRAREAGTVFQEWLVEQLGSTDIEVNPRFGRLDERTGVVLPVRSTEDEPTGASSPTGP
jgi:hypothetical protein